MIDSVTCYERRPTVHWKKPKAPNERLFCIKKETPPLVLSVLPLQDHLSCYATVHIKNYLKKISKTHNYPHFFFLCFQLDGRTLPGKIGQSPGGVGRNVADALGKLYRTPPLLLSAVASDQFGACLLDSLNHIVSSLIWTKYLNNKTSLLNITWLNMVT